MITIENELVGVRILPELAVLEKLDRQIVRIDFRFNARAQRSESIKGLGPSPLAFGILDGAIADVLRRSESEDVPRGRSRCYIAHAPANHNSQFRFEIRPVIGKGNLDFGAIRDQ